MTPHSKLLLSPTTVEDLNTLFTFQLDEQACYLAAFTPKDHSNKQKYIEKYTELLGRSTVNMQTLRLDQRIIGSISKFVLEGDAEITYWIDRAYWGRGFATKALTELLLIEPARPIFGRVAFDNTGSQRVLEKCHFKRIGSDKGYANARQQEIAEYIYQLD